MRITPLHFALCLFTTPATAECASIPNTFMSCTFASGENEVHVCLDAGNVTYAYGPVGGQPELALSVPISDADYMPWPGVSSIWETMTFHVDNISYVVSGGETRIFPENEDEAITHRTWGYIEVYEDYQDPESEKELATLSCDEGTVNFDWSQVFSEAKQSVGLCWAGFEQAWQACE